MSPTKTTASFKSPLSGHQNVAPINNNRMNEPKPLNRVSQIFQVRKVMPLALLAVDDDGGDGDGVEGTGSHVLTYRLSIEPYL
jgi:hypothetical protein